MLTPHLVGNQNINNSNKFRNFVNEQLLITFLLGTSANDFAPKPVDLSSMTLEKDMTTVAEKMAEQSHLIWAKKVSFGYLVSPRVTPLVTFWKL